MEGSGRSGVVVGLIYLFWLRRYSGGEACEVRLASVGDQVILTCHADGNCSGTANWSKMNDGGGSTVLDSVSQDLVLSVENAVDGGMYVCTCNEGAQTAQYCYSLLVKPLIDAFSATPHTVIEGESFTLTCSVQSYPNPTEDQFVLSMNSVSLIEGGLYDYTQSWSRGNMSLLVTMATLNQSGLYNCEVIVSTPEGSYVGTANSQTRVTVTTGPVLKAKNFTASKFQLTTSQSCVLECLLDITSSGISAGTLSVQWRDRNGEVLEVDAKYVFDERGVVLASGLVLFYLIVRDLSEDDVGEYYQCQVLSEGSETMLSGEVWILQEQGYSTNDNTPTLGVETTESQSKAPSQWCVVLLSVFTGIALFSVCVLGVAFSVYMLWRRRNKDEDVRGGVETTQNTHESSETTGGDIVSFEQQETDHRTENVAHV